MIAQLSHRMDKQKAMFYMTIVGTTACVFSMLFTASIALKVNGKIIRGLENMMHVSITDDAK